MLPDSVVLREVGPRDGLQVEPPLPPEDRARLVDALLRAGVRVIEVAAFVSPKAVPAMADAEAVVAALGDRPGVVRTALVANVRGAERALAAGIDALTVTIAASPAYNQRNVRMTIEESRREIAAIAALAAQGGVPVDAVISCAFGSPYEGDVPPAEVAALAAAVVEDGATSVTLADTTGMATPRRVDELLAHTGPQVGLHLHETRGTGLVNLYAGLQAGVRRYDCSVGGLGGSPFAHGAAGNVATEGVVALLDDLGVHTGIDLDLLLEAAALAKELVGHPLPSPVAAAGPRTRLSPPGG